MDFGGKYVDATLIGHGAAGAVYRARSVVFGRLVAVKVFHGTLDDERLERDFQRECQVLGRLGGHPHIVAVYDSGITDDGHPYLVMAHYDLGCLPSDQMFGTAAAGDCAIAIAQALDTAHQQGVLHRDIKPQNVLRSSQGAIALADFGVSVRSPAELTSAATTAGYAAPEVLLDHQAASPASDVYGLAATLYTLLAGHPPHPPRQDETDLHYLQRIVREPHLPLPAQVHPNLAAVVNSGLAKDPATRPASARAFGDAVREALGAPAATDPGPDLFRHPDPADPLPVPAGVPAPATSAAETPAQPPTRVTLPPVPPPVPRRTGSAAARPPMVSSPVVVTPTGAPVSRSGHRAAGEAGRTTGDQAGRRDAVTFAAVTRTSVSAPTTAEPTRRGPSRKLFVALGAVLTAAALVGLVQLVTGRTGTHRAGQLPVVAGSTSASWTVGQGTASGNPATETSAPGSHTVIPTSTGPTGTPRATSATSPRGTAPATAAGTPRSGTAAPSRARTSTLSGAQAGPYDRNGVRLGTARVTVDGNGIAVLTATVQVNRSVRFAHLQIAVRSSTGDAVDPHGNPLDVAFNDNVTVARSRTISGSRHYIGGPFTAFMAYSLDGSTWVDGPVVRFTAPN